ncbi:hypothetical protein [Candidatus Nitrosocosmicus franklandus]|uniref:Uncharacterized protein n=1 Tax=Candidatus Nitrosocosmicus franklandianus TaxID=1798806 RepID=A0A484I7F2_9ARCH|nr:hypothetical protein [Candidatus Nitrosocosmicus franklandus]VFJ13669.1 conserved protein of unknown function [Candidatus Nitrosocosmicus franklandus]
MDESTINQLIASNFRSPVITDVISDPHMMYEIVRRGLPFTEKGHNTIWDSAIFESAYKYFQDGFRVVEKQIANNEIILNLIIEVTPENVDRVSELNFPNIRHVDSLRGNMGIADQRAYMVYLFHQKSDLPDQTLFSNNPDLVKRQVGLFNKLWEISIPLSVRIRELDGSDRSKYQRMINNIYEFKDELNFIIDQSRKELLIFSSLSSLNQLFINRHNIAKIKSAQKRGVSIKILTDETDEIFSKQISELNQTNEDNPIRYGHGKSLCCFNEMVVLADGKQVLQTKNQQDGKIFALSSNEEHMVLVQDVLFEKYWNEIQSLEISDN